MQKQKKKKKKKKWKERYEENRVQSLKLLSGRFPPITNDRTFPVDWVSRSGIGRCIAGIKKKRKNFKERPWHPMLYTDLDHCYQKSATLSAKLLMIFQLFQLLQHFEG